MENLKAYRRQIKALRKDVESFEYFASIFDEASLSYYQRKHIKEIAAMDAKNAYYERALKSLISRVVEAVNANSNINKLK